MVAFQGVALTHRELKLILFVSGHKRPPAFDPLLLEDGHHGHLSFVGHHLDGALLGSLCSTREAVQVELDCTCGDSHWGELTNRETRSTFPGNPVLSTQKVIRWEVIGIPHLEIESRRNLVLSLIPGKHGFLLWDDNLLLSHQVIEGIDKAPVEVALSSDGVIMYVSVLFVLLLSFQPAVTDKQVSVFSENPTGICLFER